MPNLASMGFVGYVQFENSLVRATSADVKATQNIEKPNVVDGKLDKTVYQLGPIEVGGTIAFPAIHEDGSAVTALLWKRAIERSTADGKLTKLQFINIRYNDTAAYQYNQCLVDTFEFAAAQYDMVNISVGIIGISRQQGTILAPNNFYAFRNTRAVTWNDAVVNFSGPVTVNGDEIRNFTVSLANNSQRFYTLNRSLFPQDIAPTKRDITGSVVIMGRNNSLANRAFSNDTRCTETTSVTWGYQLGITSPGCSGDFLVNIPGVVFQIEEIAITNELLETTVNWHALPGIAFGTSQNTTNFIV